MGGNTPQHAALASQVIQPLGAQLKGRGCEIHTSDESAFPPRVSARTRT